MKRYRIFDIPTNIVIGHKIMRNKHEGDVIFYTFYNKELKRVKRHLMYEIKGVFQDTLFVKEINFKQLESKIDSEIKEATEKEE